MKSPIQRAVTTKTKTRSNGTTTVVASTPNPDRYDDVVASEWKLEAYMENPVVQFGHRYDIPPVGRTEKLSVDKTTGNLVATIRWDDAPTNALAQTVAAQYRTGFLRAVSVGFQPGDSTPRNKLPSDHPAYGEKGMFFTNNRLLEISAVPVPANGEALALRSLGMDHQAKSILNVEETDDTYIVTYAKYQAEGEEEAFGDEDEEEEEEQAEEDEEEEEEEEEQLEDEDEDEEEQTRPEPYDEEDEEEEQLEDEEDEDEEEEEEERMFVSRVRNVVLDLLGHDRSVRSALTPKTSRKKSIRARDGLSSVLGIDN